MAEPSNGNELKVKGPFGIDLAAKGPVLILLFAVAAFIGIAMWEHYKRAIESQRVIDSVNHQTEVLVRAIRDENQRVRDTIYYLDCRVQLQLYIAQKPRGESIDWNGMPDTLYKCLPEFLTKKR